MSKFKIYEFSFDGLWIAQKVLVVSTSREQAEFHARKRIKDEGFDPDTIEFVDVYEVGEGVVPYFNNGDY